MLAPVSAVKLDTLERDTRALRRQFTQLRAHLETRDIAGRVLQVLLGIEVA